MSQFPVSKSREPIVAWREWAFLYPNYLLDRGKYQAWEPRVRYEMPTDRKSTRLNSSHGYISYAVFCLKKKNHTPPHMRPYSFDLYPGIPLPGTPLHDYARVTLVSGPPHNVSVLAQLYASNVGNESRS